MTTGPAEVEDGVIDALAKHPLDLGCNPEGGIRLVGRFALLLRYPEFAINNDDFVHTDHAPLFLNLFPSLCLHCCHEVS